ncbi:MAG TPA: hypothetical protein VGL97_16965 [Bryobacteraceae bacterium]|jgi:hypothetical protein
MTNSQTPGVGRPSGSGTHSRQKGPKKKSRKIPSAALQLFPVRTLSEDELKLLSGYLQVWLAGTARREINDAVAVFVRRVAARTLLPTLSKYRARLGKASGAAHNLIALFAPISNKGSRGSTFNIENATFALLCNIHGVKKFDNEARCLRRIAKLCDATTIQTKGQRGRSPKADLDQYLERLIGLAAELNAPLELPGSTPPPAHDLDDEWKGQTPLFRFLRHALEIAVNVGVDAAESSFLGATEKDASKRALRSCKNIGESAIAKHFLRARRRVTYKANK